MGNPRAPSVEDIQAACEIMKFLNKHEEHEAARLVSHFLNEWASAAGFAQGVLEMHKMLKGEL